MGTRPLITGEMLSAGENSGGERENRDCGDCRDDEQEDSYDGTPHAGETWGSGGSLPEALAFRLEQLVVGEPPGEAQEARVRDHPVGRAHAPAPHRPAALQQLERLEHAEPADLAQAIEEALHLAHVRAVGEDDPAGPQRPLDRRHGPPWL